MTEQEFSRLSVGDVISHGLTPWGNWVIVARAYEEPIDLTNKQKKRVRCGWHAIRVIDDSMVGKVEHHRISNPHEWILREKVITREKFA